MTYLKGLLYMTGMKCTNVHTEADLKDTTAAVKTDLAHMYTQDYSAFLECILCQGGAFMCAVEGVDINWR